MAIPDFMGSSNQSLDICDPVPLTLKGFLVTVAGLDCFILPRIKAKMAVFLVAFPKKQYQSFHQFHFISDQRRWF